jgi:phage baseplate assembly protein W
MPTARVFIDIDFNLTIHPSSGDVLKVYDVNAIKQSVKSLVRTEFYGRPFHPEIGSSVAGLLFENWSPFLDEAVKTTIKDVVDSNEPRASVEDVRTQFDPSSNSYNVEIDLYLYALMQAATVDIILKRIR